MGAPPSNPCDISGSALWVFSVQCFITLASKAVEVRMHSSNHAYISLQARVVHAQLSYLPNPGLVMVVAAPKCSTPLLQVMLFI